MQLQESCQLLAAVFGCLLLPQNLQRVPRCSTHCADSQRAGADREQACTRHHHSVSNRQPQQAQDMSRCHVGFDEWYRRPGRGSLSRMRMLGGAPAAPLISGVCATRPLSLVFVCLFFTKKGFRSATHDGWAGTKREGNACIMKKLQKSQLGCALLCGVYRNLVIFQNDSARGSARRKFQRSGGEAEVQWCSAWGGWRRLKHTCAQPV